MTEGQLTLDAEAGEAAKADALDRVERHAEPDWKDQAYRAWLDVATYYKQMREPFTSDAVWEYLDGRALPRPHEPRAMAAVVRRMISEGRIRATGRYVKTARPEAHRRPIVEYEAL